MNEQIDILLVDDEPDILQFMQYNLQQEGYKISTAANGQIALALAKKNNPKLIIMDVMMPEMDGIEACKEIRKIPELKNTIIAFLSARNEDFTQIAALESGADDYITKPIKPKILISKVQALLRRTGRIKDESTNSTFKVGDIEINTEKFIVYKNGKEIILPKKEFELLALLISKPGRVFRREEIMNNVWGDDVIVGDRTIDVHIRKLREKLGESLFKTIKGIGYKFEE